MIGPATIFLLAKVLIHCCQPRRMNYRMHPVLTVLVAGATSLLLTPSSAETEPLPDNGAVDYQLGGAYPPVSKVTVVVRDSTDNPAPQLFNICYVNGFQTQPGVRWPESLLVPGAEGKPLVDAGWPDEFLLDVSTETRRELNLALVMRAIDMCGEKGFDAIEFDNLDSYTRSHGYLKQADALAFAKLLVNSAKKWGLPAAQKNAGELGTRGRDEAGFSFAIVEECYRWQECDTYTNVYGPKQVIDIEYPDDLNVDFTKACAEKSRPTKMILRDKMLVPTGAGGYLFRTCE